MDSFFSDQISNSLQMFTFPLEVIGLTLATIEVRYPGTARLISTLVAFQDRHSTVESFRLRWANSKDFSSFRYRLLMLGILIIIASVVSTIITISLVVLAASIFILMSPGGISFRKQWMNTTNYFPNRWMWLGPTSMNWWRW